MRESKGGVRTQITLTEDDIKFIYYAVNQHMETVKNYRGMPWECSMKKEAECLESLKERLPEGQNLAFPQITRNDFWFIEYTLNEHCAFVGEGYGKPWSKSARSDSHKTTYLVERLRKFLGITTEEYEQGMPE